MRNRRLDAFMCIKKDGDRGFPIAGVKAAVGK